MSIVSKNCELCGKLMDNVHHAKLYCDDCKSITLKRNQKKCRLNNPKQPKYTELEYINNFYFCIKENYHLTIKGFNSVSNLKAQSYRNYYGLPWIDILKKFDKFNELYNYIVDEYKKFIDYTKSQNIHKFIIYNNWITYELLKDIGFDKIQNDCNCKNYRPTDEDYINNFNNIKNVLGRIPLYNEFENNTNITIEGYAFKYKLKGKIYDSIVKMFASEDEYNEYLKLKYQHKSNVGKVTGSLSTIHTLEDLENNFKFIFDKCYNKYNIYPPKRYFNKISNICDKTYRERLNMSWLDVCNHYGYKVNKNHRVEKIVLDNVKELIGYDYEPQKTWEWLIGVGGKHMYCDGYFKDLKLVIEFDGRQHRIAIDKFGGSEKLKRQQENDKLKNELLDKYEINLIRIDSREKWHNIECLKQKLIINGIQLNQLKQIV